MERELRIDEAVQFWRHRVLPHFEDQRDSSAVKNMLWEVYTGWSTLSLLLSNLVDCHIC